VVQVVFALTRNKLGKALGKPMTLVGSRISIGQTVWVLLFAAAPTRGLSTSMPSSQRRLLTVPCWLRCLGAERGRSL
jgi:hypothetical protein